MYYIIYTVIYSLRFKYFLYMNSVPYHITISYGPYGSLAIVALFYIDHLSRKIFGKFSYTVVFESLLTECLALPVEVDLIF